MAPTPVATPNLIRDPGYLYWAPFATAEPTYVSTASKFSDAWPVAFIPMGATQDGSTFKWESPMEAIYAAEFLTPLAYANGEQQGSFAMGLLDFTLKSLQRAMNGGPPTTVSGSGATLVSKFEPPDPSEIVRSVIGWESLDNTMRIIGRQCINAAAVEASFKKGTDVGVIPCEFNFERPLAAKSWAIYSAGTARLGV
jgi:hypothetical protein